MYFTREILLSEVWIGTKGSEILRLATRNSHYHIKGKKDKGGSRILSPENMEKVEEGIKQSVAGEDVAKPEA